MTGALGKASQGLYLSPGSTPTPRHEEGPSVGDGFLGVDEEGGGSYLDKVVSVSASGHGHGPLFALEVKWRGSDTIGSPSSLGPFGGRVWNGKAERAQ